MEKQDSVTQVIHDLEGLYYTDLSTQDAWKVLREIIDRLEQLTGILFHPAETVKIELELIWNYVDVGHPGCPVCRAHEAHREIPRAIAIKGTRNFVCDDCAREYAPDLLEQKDRQNRVIWEYQAKGDQRWGPSKEGDIEVLNSLIAEQPA